MPRAAELGVSVSGAQLHEDRMADFDVSVGSRCAAWPPALLTTVCARDKMRPVVRWDRIQPMLRPRRFVKLSTIPRVVVLCGIKRARLPGAEPKTEIRAARPSRLAREEGSSQEHRVEIRLPIALRVSRRVSGDAQFAVLCARSPSQRELVGAFWHP